MLTTKDFCRSLRGAEQSLRKLSLTEEVRLLASLTPSEEFRRTALDPDSTYAEVYRRGMANYDYNILLTDLSFFQFHCEEYGPRPGLRYAFYPNPHPVIRFSEYVAQPQLALRPNDHPATYEDYLQYLSESPEDVRVPVVRFDLAIHDYAPLQHPAAHLHIGLHEDNRWPCARIWTPHAFVLTIVKLYYDQHWWSSIENQPDRDGGASPLDATLSAERRASPPLGTNLFSVLEQEQFHWS